MRNIIIIGMLLTAASTAGWFTIHRDGDNVSIDIDRAEIRADTSKMIDRGREALNRQEQLAAELRNQQQSGQTMNGQSQQASPWEQQQPAPWGAGQTSASYPSERGFAGPPPAYNSNGYPPQQTYSPQQSYSPNQNYAPTQYYTPPYSAPNQNYAPYQYSPNQNAPYNVPPANYPRQASPYNPQPTYPR